MNKNILYNLKFWRIFGGNFPSPFILINREGIILYKNKHFEILIHPECLNLYAFIDVECIEKITEHMEHSKEDKSEPPLYLDLFCKTCYFIRDDQLIKERINYDVGNTYYV